MAFQMAAKCPHAGIIRHLTKWTIAQNNRIQKNTASNYKCQAGLNAAYIVYSNWELYLFCLPPFLTITWAFFNRELTSQESIKNFLAKIKSYKKSRKLTVGYSHRGTTCLVREFENISSQNEALHYYHFHAFSKYFHARIEINQW